MRFHTWQPPPALQKLNTARSRSGAPMARRSMTPDCCMVARPGNQDDNFNRLHQNRAVHGGVGTHNRAFERSEEHTSELQSLMRISYDGFCLKKKKTIITRKYTNNEGQVKPP